MPLHYGYAARAIKNEKGVCISTGNLVYPKWKLPVCSKREKLVHKLQTGKCYQANQKEGPKMRERTRKALALLLAVCLVIGVLVD